MGGVYVINGGNVNSKWANESNYGGPSPFLGSGIAWDCYTTTLDSYKCEWNSIYAEE